MFYFSVYAIAKSSFAYTPSETVLSE